MSLLSTSKVRIYSDPNSLGEVVSFLQAKKCIEIIPQDEKNGIEGDSLALLDFSIRYLSPYAPEKKGLRNAVLGERIEVSEADCEKIAMNFDWKSVAKKTSELEQGRNDLLRLLEEKKSLYSTVSEWGNVEIGNSEGMFTALFIEVPVQNAGIFSKDLAEETSLFEIETVSQNKKWVHFVVYIENNKEDIVTGLLSEYKGKKIELPEGASPSQLSQSLSVEIASIQKKLDANTVSLKDLSKNVVDLKMVYDVYLSQQKREEALQDSIHSEYVSFIDGWVPTNELKLLQYSLEKQFPNILLEELEMKEEEFSPVILEASESMKSVQEITNMYGTPASDELDPTSYYALFFLVFFGFCLTDAGYGLILMLFTGLILLAKLPFEKPVLNIIRLFFYGGISTFILGVLFGGYFGLTTEQVPEFLTYTRDDGVVMFLGQIFNPMTDLVTKIMPLTYLLGVFHLLLGLYLSGKIAMKKGDTNRMHFVVLPFIALFITAGLAWGLAIAGMNYLFYALLLVIIWGLGESGNPVIRILKGVGGMLNEALSWFSNILSYSRLFALGLATGIIGMAFNIVAMTLGGMVPGIGGVVVMIFVLLFGHTLNISLNLLGAYVHASRLQFVEFFGMFLKGGGKRFSPLQKESRYRVSS